VNVVSNTFETDGDLVTGNNIVTKTGMGTWIMGGTADNNNNIILTVNEGEVILEKTSGYAIGNRSGGGLTVESNALVFDNGQGVAQVGHGQGVAVTLESGGVFDIYGNTETFDSLAMSGGGTLQNGDSGSAASLSVTGTDTGIFSLGDTNCVFNVVSNAILTINATISGTGSLVMSNLGELYLAQSNSYTGQTLIQSGAVGLATGSIDDSSGIILASNNSVLDASLAPGQLRVWNRERHVAGRQRLDCGARNPVHRGHAYCGQQHRRHHAKWRRHDEDQRRHHQ
jgi:autotransporter-associated beta strand protein